MSEKENMEQKVVENEVAEEAVVEEQIDYKDLYLREKAEKQNFMNQTKKDMQTAVSFANERIIKDLIPIMDTFELALGYNPKDQGILMLKDQFLSALKKYGVEAIEPKLGEDFNSSENEALESVESEEYDAGKIAKVLQNGYKLHGRIIRSARVAVVKNNNE